MSSRQGKKIFNISVLQRVLSIAAPYKKRFYFSVLLSIVLAIMAPVRPLLIQLTINQGMKEGAVSNFISGPGGFIIEITIIQIFFLLIETATRFYFTYTTASLGQSVVKDLRVLTYKKVLNLNVTQFDKTPIGTLTTRTINDIESVNDIFSDGLIPIIADLLSIISVLTYMFWVDWRLTLVCLAPFPLLIVATYIFKESVNKSFIKVRNAVAGLNAFVQEHISGMSLVQAFAAEKGKIVSSGKSIKNIGMPTSKPSLRILFFFRWWNWFLPYRSACLYGGLPVNLYHCRPARHNRWPESSHHSYCV